MEELLFRLLALLERLGVWLSILAWFTVSGGAAAMAWALGGHMTRARWRAGVAVFGVALAANLADYLATFYRDPELRFEANPMGRMAVDTFGVEFARWYGLTGKIFVSILAGQMFAFYLANRERLYPAQAGSLTDFLRGLGGRARTLRERLLALFTVFCFFFAGINLLYFYVAFVNSVTDPETHVWLPPFPLVIVLLVAALAAAFALLTYRAYRRDISATNQ